MRALILAALLLAGCAGGGETKRFPHAILTPEPAKAVPVVPLVDGAGKAAPKDLFSGHWTWLYFGFANCPDVCPLALEYATAEYKKLRNPKAVKVVFISVDPARDRSPTLTKFVTFYHPDFLGLTGEKADLDTLAKAVGASYVLDKPKQPGANYDVSHTNLVFVLDPEGKWVATYVPGAKPGAMTEDFDQLTKENP